MTELKKRKSAPKKRGSEPLGPAGLEAAEEFPGSEGGPHQDDEGVWHDLDDPPLVRGPHVDPDEPAHVYDEDEPWYADPDERWDEERRGD